MPQPKFKSENYQNFGGMNTKVSKYNTGPHEFLNLENFDMTVPGALSSRPGTTQMTSSTLTGRITSLYEFERLSGFSQIIVSANTNLYFSTGANFTPFLTGLVNNALFDFVTFVDRLFLANGDTFKKYDGSSATSFSLPPGTSTGFAPTMAVGGGLSGVFVVGYGYQNDRGYYGPVGSRVTLSLNGITFGTIQYGSLTAPSGFGISAMAIYRTLAGGVDLFGTTNIVPGPTFVDAGLTTTNRISPTYLYFTLAPRFLEVFNNQLLMLGFSSLPSTFFWSDVGEPEGVQPGYFAEVRTNDGDRLTGAKVYNGGCQIFKQRSFHELRGDNPANFTLREISAQYGCLSNRAVVQWENVLWFLDAKGICEYNGANISIVSEKVEPTFLTMNIEAAVDQAAAIYHKTRNEIWFAIPTSGSTFNNTLVVFDHVARGWAIWSGVLVSSLAFMKGPLDQRHAFVGTYTGTVSFFSTLFPSDNGATITSRAQGRFIGDLGNSVTKMFRRLYTDVNVSASNILSFNIRKDYGASIVFSGTMYQDRFQQRADFGVDGKSISIEFVHASASMACRIEGYTVEYRMQRMV